jgi:hypothetical protein
MDKKKVLALQQLADQKWMAARKVIHRLQRISRTGCTEEGDEEVMKMACLLVAAECCLRKLDTG